MNKGHERKKNLLSIIDTLQRCGALTQSQLKDHCGLQASTVSYLIKDLEACGFIRDLGRTSNNGKAGKPGSMIALNNDKASFLGIYAEDNSLDAHLVGIDESTLEEQHVILGDLKIEDAISSLIRMELAQHPQIRGVGIAIKAIVHHDGSIRSARRQNAKGSEGYWNFTGMRDKLRQTFPNILTAVENDANCAAMLHLHQTGRRMDNLIVCLINKNPFGIGCGLIVNGQLFRGATGAAGEFFDPDSRLRVLAETTTGEEDFLDRFIPAIQPALMDALYMMDPEMLVLTGSMFEGMGEDLRRKIEQAFRPSPVSIQVKGGHEQLNPANGAALLVTNDYVASFIEEVKKR